MKNTQVKQIVILSILFLGTFFLFSFFQKNKELKKDDQGNVIANQIGENYFAGKTI